MGATKTINAVLLLVVLGAVAWGIAAIPKPPQDIYHPLPGTKEGDAYVYTDDQPYYTVEVRYPAKTALAGAADAAARTAIEAAFAAEVAQFKQDSNLDNLTQEDIEVQRLGGDRKYTLELNYTEYASARFDSFLTTIYADTLGAHPNGNFLSLVFNQAGEQVALRQLFVAGSPYLSRISQQALAQVRQTLAERGGPDAAADIFVDGLAPQEENFQDFVINGDTLMILIPPYQAAAYAAGTFEVDIPLSSLQDILAPGVR